LTWSPDGSYLAYVSTQANGATLFIWNGESNIPIHHSSESISDMAWSHDGRLAFTVFLKKEVFPYEDDTAEIFIWDGKTTTSLSQNPTGDDRSPAWNKDGQLAFLSERDGDYDIFIWDGTSKVNDVADVNTFINVAPHLTSYFSHPVWTNSGSLSFGGLDAQIYAWNEQNVTNVSLNPDFHNGGQSWRSDGYWAFITYFSSEQLVYIRDEKNKTILATEGQYAPAWSENGYLMFCNSASRRKWIFSMSHLPRTYTEHSGWVLSMWTGRKIIDIAQGSEIEAAWPNGENIFCSSG
jgi:Tol biopolymer transport system component